MRLAKVRRLLTRDLITRQEYGDKTGALISEYESTHPSIGDRLKFLRSLKDKQYIDGDAYTRSKKRLLDSLWSIAATACRLAK